MDIAGLGIAVDSSSLLQTKKTAQEAAQSLDKVAVATENLEKKDQKAKTTTEAFTREIDKQSKIIVQLDAQVKKLTTDLEAQARKYDELTRKKKENNTVLGQMAVLLAKLKDGFGTATSSIGSMVAAAATLRTAFKAFIALEIVQWVINLGKSFVRAGDDILQMQMRLRGAFQSAQVGARAFQDISRIAQETGSGIDQVADSFLRLARNAGDLGATRRDIADLTETVLKLGAVAGTSGNDIAGALIQLSQALASGRLNGDELRSILERAPPLAKAIAEGLGVSVGQLRAMGAAGELTAYKVLPAIVSQLEKARAEYEALPDTVERAWGRAGNAGKDFLSQMNALLGVSTAVGAVFNGFAYALEKAARGAEAVNKLLDVEAFRRLMSGGSFSLPDPNSARYLMKGPEEEYARGVSDRRGATVTQGLQTAKELDDLTTKQTKLAEQTETVRRAMAGLNEQLANGEVTQEQYKKYSDALARSMTILGAETQKAQGAVAEFMRNSEAAIKAANSGVGAEREFMEQYLQLVKKAQEEGSKEPSLQQVRIQMSKERAAALKGEIDQLEYKILADQRMAVAIREGAGAVEEAEIQSALYQKRMETFGRVTTPEVEAAMRAYERALRDAGAAGKDVVSSTTIRNMEKQLEMLRLEQRYIGASNDERNIALALMRKEAELRERNIDLTSEQAQKELALARQIAQQENINARLERQAQETERIWLRAAEGIQDALVDAFESAFEASGSIASRFAEGFKKLMISIAAQVAAAMVFRPVIGSVLGAVGAPSNVLQQFTGVGGGSSGAMSAVNGLSTASSLSNLSSMFSGNGMFSASSISNFFSLSGNPLATMGSGISGFLGGPTLLSGAAQTTALTEAAMLAGSGAPITALSPLAATGIGVGLLVAGFALSKLLGGKKSVGPNGGAYADLSSLGALSGMVTGSDNGGSSQGSQQMLQSASEFLSQILASTGGKLADGTRFGFSQWNEGFYGFAQNAAGYIPGFEPTASKGGTFLAADADEAMARLVKVLLQSAEGLSETTRTILANTKAAKSEELAADLAFGETYESLTGTVEKIEQLRQQLDAQNKTYDDAIERAKELGLATEILADKQAEAAQKFVEGVNRNYRELIMGIENPTALRDLQLQRARVAELANVGSVGGDLTLVNRYYDLLAQQNAANDVTAAFTALSAAVNDNIATLESQQGAWSSLAASMKQTREGLLINPDLSVLSPQDRLQAAQSQYQEALTAAQGGDLQAAGRLSGLAQQLLTAGRGYYASSAAYQALFSQVQADLSGIETQAKSQSDILLDQLEVGRAQLDAARAQLEALGFIKSANDNIAAGLTALSTAISNWKTATGTGGTGNTGTGGTIPGTGSTGTYQDRNNSLYELYTKGLGRAPDEAGFSYWQNELASGKTYADIYNAFINTPEYKAVHPNALGNAFRYGNVIPFANGGVVNRPTLFSMSNGRTGLMGEAGDEAIMPLQRMANGRLGVESQINAGVIALLRSIDDRLARLEKTTAAGSIMVSEAVRESASPMRLAARAAERERAAA